MWFSLCLGTAAGGTIVGDTLAGGGIVCSCKSSTVSSSTTSSLFLGFVRDIAFSYYIARVDESIKAYGVDTICCSGIYYPPLFSFSSL